MTPQGGDSRYPMASHRWTAGDGGDMHFGSKKRHLEKAGDFGRKNMLGYSRKTAGRGESGPVGVYVSENAPDGVESEEK